MEEEQVHLAESRGYPFLDFNHSISDSRTKESDNNQPEPCYAACKGPKDHE